MSLYMPLLDPSVLPLARRQDLNLLKLPVSRYFNSIFDKDLQAARDGSI